MNVTKCHECAKCHECGSVMNVANACEDERRQLQLAGCGNKKYI